MMDYSLRLDGDQGCKESENILVLIEVILMKKMMVLGPGYSTRCREKVLRS